MKKHHKVKVNLDEILKSSQIDIPQMKKLTNYDVLNYFSGKFELSRALFEFYFRF